MGESAKKLDSDPNSKESTKILINELEILDTFHVLQENKSRFLLWKKQVSGEQRQRVICAIYSSNLVENEVHFIDLTGQSKAEDMFSEEKELFCFNPDKNLLFKSSIKEIKTTTIVLNFPARVNIINSKDVKIILPELSDYKLSSNKNETVSEVKKQEQPASSDETSIETVEEAEKKFAEARNSPRGKASGEQVIEVVFTSGPKTGERAYYELFDLSVGGLSFITFDEEEVPKGTTLNITNLGGSEKKPPIKAEIASLALLSEDSNEFKIGVKFI